MYIVLGASGHIGSALTQALLDQGQAVTIVSHDPEKARAWERKGAQAAVADVHNPDALRKVLRQGRRLFLLNPPAPPATDTQAEERASVQAILKAVEGSGLEKIVAESTYGAAPGRGGDLGVLYEMERMLAVQPIPHTVIRAAYYMSNWDNYLKPAREQGKIQTFYPADFALPMVAPADIGAIAARLLQEPAAQTGTYYVEGPQAYTANDVAAAYAKALHKPVRVEEIPKAGWKPYLLQMGFSDKAADSFVDMTAATLDNRDPKPASPLRGTTTMEAYIEGLVGADL